MQRIRDPLRMNSKKDSIITRNIIVFEQTGAGKSSIINILGGRPVANVSNSKGGARNYTINCLGYTYTFWVPGHNESQHGTLPAVALSPDLLIYCIRDKPVDINRHDFELFRKNLRRERIPTILVVTGLEHSDDMDKWWGENEKIIRTMKMSFDGHACIKGTSEEVWILVMEHCGPRHNVIVFGESGCGKSSLINMFVGKDVAKVSDSLTGCTFTSDAYKALIDDKLYVIYDTAGLNEGEQGRVPHWEAIRELYTLIRQLSGVSLLVFCMRGRLRENTKANWILFNKVICGGKVPVVVVVTGLDAYKDPDDWWKNEDRRKAFEKNGIVPDDVGCVVSTPGPNGEYKDVYGKSRANLHKLIIKHHLQKPWGEDERKEKWFSDIYQNVYHQDLCFISRSRPEYSQHMRGIVDEFIQETNMDKGDAVKLEATLLKAEKKFRKRRLKDIDSWLK